MKTFFLAIIFTCVALSITQDDVWNDAIYIEIFFDKYNLPYTDSVVLLYHLIFLLVPLSLCFLLYFKAKAINTNRNLRPLYLQLVGGIILIALFLCLVRNAMAANVGWIFIYPIPETFSEILREIGYYYLGYAIWVFATWYLFYRARQVQEKKYGG